MSGGWIIEQVSDDHTVVPDLTPAIAARTSSAPVTETAVTAMPVTEAAHGTGPGHRTSPPWGSLVRTLMVGAGAVVGTVAVGVTALWFFGLTPPPPEPPATLAMVDQPTQRFLVAEGLLYLEGQVMTEQDLQRLQEVAEELVGPDNVINNLTIWPGSVVLEPATSGAADTADDRAGSGEPVPPIAVGVNDTVRFGTGRADVQARYAPVIELTVQILDQYPTTTLTIVGHTDDRGGDQLNLDLSLARAQAVADEVAARGIDRDRLRVVGRGELEPAVPNDSSEGRSTNRRVEFLVSGLLD